MSVYIKGMEMPHDPNGVTICIFPDGVAKCMDMVSFEITTKEAVPVPPHGRLVDADALMEQLGDVEYKGAIKRVLIQAPTIIEADKEDE